MTTFTTVETVEVRHRIVIAAGLALLGAGLILLMFVLPAEYAVDPLGVGTRLGLMDLGVTGQQVEALNAAGTARGEGAVPIIAPQDRRLQSETIEFKLAPREGMEYKYRLDKGQVLHFSWDAPVPVNFEAHAEPDGGPRGYAQTYEKGTRQRAAGTLTAPFTGIHGWYWENTTDREITVRLSTSGFYNLAHEFRDGQPVRNHSFPAS